MKPLLNKKILVVDDEEMLREVLCDALALLGADVLAAPNGHAALDAINQSHPHLVITDLRMAGGDGLTLLAAIRQGSGPKPLVFICTAFSDIDEEQAKELGATALFTKPFDWRSFREAVIGALAPA